MHFFGMCFILYFIRFSFWFKNYEFFPNVLFSVENSVIESKLWMILRQDEFVY